MFILIVFIISAFMGITLFLFIPDKNKAGDISFNIAIGFAILAIFINITTKQPKIVSHKDIKIYSTTSSSQQKVYGQFILGTDFIRLREYYLTNIEKKPGQFERLYIPVDKVIRIIDNNLTNYAIYRKFYCVEKSWFATSDFRPCYKIMNKKDILFIPKNAMIKQLKFQ